MITQSELKEVLDYNPDTGLFTWIESNGCVKAGDIARYKHHTGYINITITGKAYQAHRLAYLYMTGNFPKNSIDHINHVKDDNRWTNLRDATSSQNKSNIKKLKNNTSGYKGVSWDKRDKNWRAQIKHMNKNINIGSYTTPQEASEAYKKKAIEIYGEFSYTE